MRAIEEGLVAASGALEFVENAFGADSFAAIHFQI
jgi:hypothetical protein